MKQILILLLLSSVLCATAQKAVIEESVTDVVCTSSTQAIKHFKESTTILNEQGSLLARFVCSCSKNDKLTKFKGQVTDATGRVIRKIKESELRRTEYSPYLAIDDYQMYFEYTPPVFPVTITYEWTIESNDNLIEFPAFCPVGDYDVSLKKATYRLTAPAEMHVRCARQNISQNVSISGTSKDTQVLTLELNDLPAMKRESYSRTLRERLPLAYFAPTEFEYYKTRGSLQDWTKYGLWEYSLIKGSEALPPALCQELHQITDQLPTNREKVRALYNLLGKRTRYVAILLGIGGQKPAPAASVSKSGFGDCKGLSNFMRAMLKEAGIASNYVTISTTNRRLLKDFASVGQTNHAILQVPLANDTLWLECTNPQLPMGFLHEDITGHDAIEINENGGRMVQLPVYADSVNLMHSNITINLDENGAADVRIAQESLYGQYEDRIPLLKMDEKDRQKALLRMLRVPQATISQMNVGEDEAKITVSAEVKSQCYATKTGQRLFVPICPIHNGYTTPYQSDNRQEDIFLKNGYLDEDEITIVIPQGYDIEARPKDQTLDHPFATFSFSVVRKGDEVHVRNRLLMKSGTYDKALYPQLVDFIRSIGSVYGQKIVLKKQ